MQKKKTRAGSKMAAIMFVDIKDFSRFTNAQIECFATKLLPSLAKVINPYRARFLEFNTWGDAIVAVADDAVTIARLALDIRDYFRSTNFEAMGLPRVLYSRISLHAGTVNFGHDPIRRRLGVIGASLTVAARIEPIVVPGEVWITETFSSVIQPHLRADRLALDDLGERELSKGFGTYSIRKLRREDEPAVLNPVAQETLKARVTRSNLTKRYDVIALGALNLDYIATSASLSKLSTDLVSENESLFELGKERIAPIDEVGSVIGKIGHASLYPSLGGSAFNTIHTLARAVPTLQLAYIGVSGKTPGASGFIEALNELGVDVQLVKKSSTASGVCVSYVTRGERSLLTSPGANTEIADHLEKSRRAIVDAMGRSKIVHVTSLFDPKSPKVLVDILREAKEKNPWLQISFDPGHEWIRKIKTMDSSEAVFIQEILSLSSYVFLNNAEFELLGSDLQIQGDLKIAEEVFDRLSPQALLILLKRYDEIKIFHRLHNRIKEKRFGNNPLPVSQIEDATGAGDVFAAGLFAAASIPGLELKDGIELGLRLARRKLVSPGSTQFQTFSSLVEDYVDSVYGSS